MAISNVEIKLSENNKIKYLMRARLIGAVTEDEASKIIFNEKIYNRVYRQETSSIKEFMNVIDKNFAKIKKQIIKEDEYMKLVAVLHRLKDINSSTFTNIERQQLFISEPISFATKINNSYNKIHMNTIGTSTMFLEKMEA